MIEIVIIIFYFQIRSTGTCHGDSGGPLIVHDAISIPPRHIQVGIVQGALACGSKDFPGIYVRIDDKQVWSFIHDTIINNKKIGTFDLI